ncbi:DUF155-domain-containing protein [Trichocladium antarcticum]|uniref:DUF155-domain-containing protein n=1 Tax=Trichocladium antarcticum TaxID=1450529 RepID=A0AAN6UQT4_9PEZI|nr:DUF155-domain-containing protein [Trichocladium antarcticum]
MASREETEHTPLLPTPGPPSPESSRVPRPQRNVSFNPNPVTKTIEPEAAYHQLRPSQLHRQAVSPHSSSAIATGGVGGGPPMLSALNNRLRRRNSHGSAPGFVSGGGLPLVAGVPHLPKIGPQRTSKNAQKLKILPLAELDNPDVDDESGRDVYSQYTRITDPTARRDAARLGKADRDRLPRVTAYCTANRYQMDGLIRFLKGRGKGRGANPKLIDECIYTPYNYGAKQGGDNTRERVMEVLSNPERRHSTGNLDDLPEESQSTLANGLAETHESRESIDDDLLIQHLEEAEALTDDMADFDIRVHTPEVFLFDYGVVVIWGMSAAQEQRFLKEIAKFEVEKLGPDDVETEKFNFYYTHEYQARIYNDFITLRDKGNYMTKLAISHALAQSVKTSLFEELIASTIDTCKGIPAQLALTGKINLPRSQINMQIGELFILRISIHLNGSVLDTPELFWVEPQLEPVYQAVRSYLEMDQRVGLLTERLDVIADLLAVLKDQLSHGHGEKLEWIVIVLIAAEILVALVNIAVDLYVGI